MKMAERTGLEPATPGVTGRYSNQLNYRSISSHVRISDRKHENFDCFSIASIILSRCEILLAYPRCVNKKIRLFHCVTQIG